MSNMGNSSFYRIGLGHLFLKKARIIFTLIIVLFIITSTATVYAGITSGELEKQIITPFKNAIVNFNSTMNEIAKESEENNKTHTSTSTYTSTSSATTTIEINNQTPSETNRTQYYYYKYNPYPTETQTQSSNSDIDSWWKQVQENFNKNSAADQKAYEDAKVENERKLQEFRAQTDKEMQEFKDSWPTPPAWVTPFVTP